MSAENEITDSINPDDVQKAEILKNEANEYFKSKSPHFSLIELERQFVACRARFCNCHQLVYASY